MVRVRERYRQLEPTTILPLGQAFASNTVNTAVYRHHGVVTRNGLQFAAFYRGSNALQVVKRELRTGRVEQTVLENRNSLADAHNIVSLGIDAADHVHMAVCTHAGRLHYRVTREPGDIQSWSVAGPMTGVREDRVTYPTFIMAPADRRAPLLFLYRNGLPEKGEALLKQYSLVERKWIDRHEAILSGMYDQPRSSGPYWNHPVWDAGGALHLSFVWRTAPVGERRLLNNRGIDYARSMDEGLTWLSTNGLLFHLPITQVHSETVHLVAPGTNLMNQNGMAVDSKGNPHIVFYADDANGIPQYQHLWRDAGHWRFTTVSDRVHDFDLSLLSGGRGTMALPISRPEIVMDKQDRAYVIFRADFTGDRLALLRLHPPEYVYDPAEVRILWNAPVGYAEPVIDRMRWSDEQVLTMLVQKNGQPLNEQYSRPEFEPIQLVDWADLA